MIDFFGLFTVDTLYVLLGMGVVIIALLALCIVNTVKLKKMGDNYNKFIKNCLLIYNYLYLYTISCSGCK